MVAYRAMASLGRFIMHMKMCKSYYLQVEQQYLHLAAVRSMGQTTVTSKMSRADKVKRGVKFGLHEILQNKEAYHNTVFTPRQIKSTTARIAVSGHSDLNFVQDYPSILQIVNETADHRKEEVLKSHFSGTLASIRCFNERSLDLCLYELDALFANSVDITVPVYAFLSLLDIHWMNLMDKGVIQPRHVVHMMFFIGVIRNAPATLFQNLEDYLNMNSDSLDIKEWSLVCNTFFASNRRISSVDLIIKIADVLLRDHNDCPLNLLGNFVKVLHHSGYSHVDYFMQLGDALCERSDLSKMHTLTSAAHILALYASVRLVHERLFDVIKQGTNHALQFSKSRNRLTKDLCRICWALTSLQEHLPPTFLRTLEEELVDNIDHYLWTIPETVIEILTTLAMNDIYPQVVYSKVFTKAFLDFKRKRLLEQDFQMQLLEMSAHLNIPSLKRKTVTLKLEHSQPELKTQLARRTGLQPLVKGLLRCLPSSRCMALHYILPHSRIIDVELKFNSQGKPIALSHGLQDDTTIKMLQEHFTPSGNSLSIMENLGLLHCSHSGSLDNLYSKTSKDSSRKAEGGIRVVIKVYGWNQFTRRSPRLLGLPQHEVNLLNQLGYHVIGINPADASKMEDWTDAELDNYIECNIFRRLQQQL